jgi:hypothetical protein
MKEDMVTIELAKLFESQGYHQDALDTYRALEAKENGSLVQAGINRMEMKLAMAPDTPADETVKTLLGKWVGLVLLQHRLKQLRQIKSRLA